MMHDRKVGLFGGTFDPIHRAHLVVAREAATQVALDEVLFVPAATPPHKTGATVAGYEHRYRMVEIACRDDPDFVPSRLEEGRGKSYSIMTIERLRANLAPEDEIYFLIGADAFAEIRTWHKWEEVIQSVSFIVVTRPGHDYEVPPGACVNRLETIDLPISSSAIRQKLAAGEPTPELPDSVRAYIDAHNLYRPS